MLHNVRITSDPGCIPGRTIARTTEKAALKELPRARQKELDAVKMAIEKTKQRFSGEDQLKLIDLVFWKGTHNVDGAAYKIGYSSAWGRKVHSDFIRLVGFCYGLEDLT